MKGIYILATTLAISMMFIPYYGVIQGQTAHQGTYVIPKNDRAAVGCELKGIWLAPPIVYTMAKDTYRNIECVAEKSDCQDNYPVCLLAHQKCGEQTTPCDASQWTCVRMQNYAIAYHLTIKIGETQRLECCETRSSCVKDTSTPVAVTVSDEPGINATTTDGGTNATDGTTTDGGGTDMTDGTATNGGGTDMTDGTATNGGNATTNSSG